MKSRIILTMLGLAVVCFVTAQQQAPEVTASAGGIDHTKTISLAWTLGELATATNSTDNMMLTEGYHQPILQVEAIPDLITDEKSDQFLIFPNPVSSTLEVRIKEDPLHTEVSLQLTDIKGNHLFRLNLPAHQFSKQIDMQGYPAGSYFLQCLSKDGALLKTFKVIKSH